MTDVETDEVRAEIEALRADLKRRSDEWDRRQLEATMLDLPTIDVSRLELPQIRALIAQRFAEAKYENRLRDVERRLSELEARNA